MKRAYLAALVGGKKALLCGAVLGGRRPQERAVGRPCRRGDFVKTVHRDQRQGVGSLRRAAAVADSDKPARLRPARSVPPSP